MALITTFTLTQAARLLGLSRAELRRLPPPTGRRRGRPAYTFADLATARREHARQCGAPETVATPSARVVRINFRRPHARRQAWALFLQASELDEKPETLDQAAALYRAAISFDPTLAIAYVNLGNIHYRRRDEQLAQQLYREALRHDPTTPEAHYNLGYVEMLDGNTDAAIAHFLQTVAHDPGFEDAIFFLAMAYERIGKRLLARPYWERYLTFNVPGDRADLAREYLSQ